jgi:hypothetical protein
VIVVARLVSDFSAPLFGEIVMQQVSSVSAMNSTTYTLLRKVGVLNATPQWSPLKT